MDPESIPPNAGNQARKSTGVMIMVALSDPVII
jgi:hypothetical protein